jgi:putative PEP-CTERM system TPR-repeat lipoprotein
MNLTTSRYLAAVFVALVTVALSVATVSAATTENAVDERGSSRFYEDALKRFHEGKYRGAAIQLKNALQRNPRSLPARILLGRALNKLRLGSAAENQLKIARGAGADDALTLVPLGEAYLTQGKFEILLRELPPGQRPTVIEAGVRVLRGMALLQLRVAREAEQEFNKALKLQPEHVRALIGLASLRLSKGRLKSARALVDQATKHAPENENVWHLKGKLRQNIGDWKGALENYNRAISLSENLLSARVDRAATLLALGRQKDAAADIEFVRKIIPKHPQAGLLHALILARQNKTEEAAVLMEDINGWLDVLPSDFVNKHPPTLMLMGTIHYTLKRFEEALPRLQRYVELMPHVVSARKMLATIYMRRGDPAYALRLLEPALRRAPNDLQLLTLLGTAYTRTRQYEKATGFFEKLATLAPRSTIAHTELAVSRMATGQMDQARVELEKAVKLNPARGRAGALLGLMHLRRRDTDSVLEIAGRMSKANPKSPFPLNLAGSAYVQAKKFKKARESFKAALAIQPNYHPALYNLAVIAGRLEGPEAAKQHYLAILKSDASQIRAMSAMANIALRRGDTDGAVKWLDRASKTDPTAIKPQLRLVNLWLRKGQLTEAMQMAESMENREPSNLAVLDVKARIQRANVPHRSDAAFAAGSPGRVVLSEGRREPGFEISARTGRSCAPYL